MNRPSGGQPAMSRLLLPVFLLLFLKTRLLVTEDLLGEVPGCMESCSRQVNCTISPNTMLFCGEQFRDGPDFAAEPRNLTVDQSQDKHYHYVNLTWEPPRDGSYNFLTGFMVQVTLVKSDGSNPGVGPQRCYVLKLPTLWRDTHKKLHHSGGVLFNMNCIRVPVNATIELVISINSMPVNKKDSKMVTVRLPFKAQTPENYWNPQISRWADSNDVMHILVRNPYREAKYYEVDVKSVETGTVVFRHIYPSLMDSEAKDDLLLVEESGLPHFLVPGLRQYTNNYSINLLPLGINKSYILGLRAIKTMPFKLNFTQPASMSPIALADQGLDNRLVIGVSVVVTVVVTVLVCLVWRGVISATKLRALTRICSSKLRAGGETRRCFQPIYCQEDQLLLSATESHISLLRRLLKLASEHSRSQPTTCCFPISRQSGLTSSHGHDLVVIYLSPHLADILALGPSCPSDLPRQDVLCHKALWTLSERGPAAATPVLVTFDCFQQTEVSCVENLRSFLFSKSPGESSSSSLEVLKIAGQTPNGWKLAGIDTLVSIIGRQQGFPANTLLVLRRGSRCDEAKDVERCLALYEQLSDCQLPSEQVPSGPPLSPPVSLDFERSSVHSQLSSSDNCQDFDSDDQEAVTFLHRESFTPISSGFYSGPESHQKGSQPLHNGHLTSTALAAGQGWAEGSSPSDSLLANSKNSCSCVPRDVHESRDFRLTNEGQSPRGRVTNPHMPSCLIFSGSNCSVSRDWPVRPHLPLDYLHQKLPGAGARVGATAPGAGSDQLCAIIPPSLSQFPSLDSVCERINRMNENSGWSEHGLAAI